jgi:LmbE family N-acetylglucosaminyl deacetylase
LKPTKFHIQTILFVGVAALVLAAPAISLAEDSGVAQDVTARSHAAAKEDGRAVKRTRDNKVETYAEYGANEPFSLVWDADAAVRTAYVKWYAQPDYAILVQSDANGAELSRETIDHPNYNDVYAILPEACGLTLLCESGMQIAEVALYSEGALPDGVYDWQPPLDKADLLVVSAHCDDELIFFGGTIPYYAGERGLAVQVVYMANGDRARVDEALNGLRHAGLTNAPVFLPLKDVYTETLRLALLNWDETETTCLLVEQIRRFQPEVIVTHDLGGEYGHGAHMATAFCMVNAVPQAADATVFPDSAEQFGAWQTQKLYLHLYPENQITMDWNQPLAAFGGKTALEVANDAYHMHVSQLEYHSDVYADGDYSSLRFGLAFTAVGQDVAKDDFFEHINPARLSNYVAPTPASTATPMITATPLPTAEPEEPMQSNTTLFLIAGISAFVAAFSAAVAVVVLRKKKNK